MDLSSRTVLVTGSARGLGRAIILAAAERGARTAVHYNTSADAAAAVVDEALQRGASDATSVQADVTDPDGVDELFHAIEAGLGPVDVLVNNVGDFAPEHWETTDYATWQRVLQTNLDGTMLCAKRALPSMRSNDYGRIVNIGYASSEKGLVNPVNFPYFVAKAGVIMFTRMLAAETQSEDITVNAVSPYVLENSDVMPEELPRGRPATFEEVIQPLLFFLRPDASYVSGQNLEIDGGWLPESV